MSGTVGGQTLPDGLIPAASRIYPVPLPPAGSTLQPIPVASKSSADVLDYSFDFTAFLSGTTDQIDTVTVIAPNRQNVSYPVVAIWALPYGNTAVVMLASGQPNTAVSFSVEIETQQGRVFAVPAIIIINQATPATPPPSAGQVLPSDVTQTGGVFVAGATALPQGLFSNGGIIMTANSNNLPAGTISNGGVLMKASNQ